MALHPIQIFTDSAVKNLLQEFYIQNFVFRGIEKDIASNIIDKAWNTAQNFNTTKVELARQEITELFKVADQNKKNTLTDKVQKIFEVTNSIEEFKQCKSILDFGTNNLDFINKVSKHNKNIKRVFAADVIPQKNKFHGNAKFDYIKVKFNAENIGFPNSFKVDLINCRFVLHHLNNDDEAAKVLNFFANALPHNGPLILWEESFTQNPNNLSDVRINLAEFDDSEKSLNSKFNKLTLNQKKQFIYVNDWIINLNNIHMQWANMYKSVEEWIDLAKVEGFKVVKTIDLGLRITGKIKQGVHTIIQFKRI